MKEQHIELSIDEILQGFKRSDTKGLVLLLDPEKNRVYFMLNGEGSFIGSVLSQAMDTNHDFLKIVLATIATKATRDEKFKKLFKVLVKQVGEF